MSDRRKCYEFADRLNAARKRAGLRYKDISRITGIPYGTLSGYFRGGRVLSQERLRAIADAVCMSVDELLGEN